MFCYCLIDFAESGICPRALSVRIGKLSVYYIIYDYICFVCSAWERTKKSDDRGFLECSFCEKMFQSKSGLAKHTTKHTGETRYMCSTCGKRYPQRYALVAHMTTHGYPKVKCHSCDKTFITKSGMVRHAVCHKETAGSHKCEHCGASFHRPDQLKDHFNGVHSTVMAYVCFKCGKGFKYRQSLNKHKKKVHKSMHFSE